MSHKSSSYIAAIVVLTLSAAVFFISEQRERSYHRQIKQLIEEHARAWETGDDALLDKILDKESVFIYPGHRLDKTQTLNALRYFHTHFRDTKISIKKIIIEGDNIAVEWQFASTHQATNQRHTADDAIIGNVKEGRIVQWREYVDNTSP